MKKYIKLLIVAMSVLMLPVMDADAKGFSSSRSSFSSGRSSFSSSTSKPSAVKPSSGFSSSNSKPNTVAPKIPAQKSAFEIAQQRKAITPPPPKDTFVNDFKKNNTGKYPSMFNTKPSIRPNYIPPVTTYNNRERQIEYNPQTRSYGFFDDFGKFMVYDAITDIALGAFQKEQTVYVQKTEELKKAEEKATAEELKQKESEENIMTGVFVFVGAAFLVMLFVVIKSTL